MADDFSIRIDGIDEIMKALDAEPKELVRRVFGKAIQASLEPIKAATYARTPVTSNSHENTPKANDAGTVEVNLYAHLRDALKADVTVGEQGGVGRVHFVAMSYIARFVEYCHREVSHKPEKKE